MIPFRESNRIVLEFCRKAKTPPPPQPSILHVGSLTRNVNEAHIKEIFGNYGEVVNVELAIDRIVSISSFFPLCSNLCRLIKMDAALSTCAALP